MPEEEKTALYDRAMKKGENLMPYDVAKIMGKRRIKKYGWEESAKVICEIMERCGFWCDMQFAAYAITMI